MQTGFPRGGDGMIKVAFYDTKEYDKPSFERYGGLHDNAEYYGARYASAKHGVISIFS